MSPEVSVRKLYLAAAIMLALVCLPEGRQQSAQVSGLPETLTYAKELDVHLDHMTKKPSGLYVLDVKEGTGPEVGAGQVGPGALHRLARQREAVRFQHRRVAPRVPRWPGPRSSPDGMKAWRA